ncbi:lysozyme inhibitor LprI family protein [Erwinia mallotivora]|uniref:lysozyme inhibitor LprI family protein n=1 Tax=Erwinia mallotivora TaxID=69222 RepID=UPI0035EB88BD
MKLLKLMVLFLFSSSAMAALFESTEGQTCFRQYSEPVQQNDCLSKAKQESETHLDALISETDKRIKANNPGPFNGVENIPITSGDMYSKRFLMAQKIWKQYRKKMCLAVATELDEDAYDYQSFIDQCEINLNKRHEEEIHLMGLPAAR